MDARRFDQIARSLSRRGSRRGLVAGGIAAGVATLGRERAAAATTCSLEIQATTVIGRNEGTVYTGTLNLEIGDDGAIDNGSFDTSDGESFSLVGQATGRALHLRITLDDTQVLALAGTAENDLILCRGDASGTFGGPDDTDLGTWRTVDDESSDSGSSGATSASSNSGSNSPSGSSNLGGGNNSDDSDDSDNDVGSGSNCASGVVCGGVCCEPAPGLFADNIACVLDFCECTYSCASAGCGGGDGFIVNTCGSDPEPKCHSECNFTEDEDEVDDCGGADLMSDANNCGFCGLVCASGFCQNGVCTASDPCIQTGLTNCNSQCFDTQNDPQNCGGCGIFCQSGQCIEGNCTDVVN